TGQDNSNDGFAGLTYPGLQDQITNFLGSHQDAGADPDALYVVWAGANDFLALLNPAGSGTTSTSNGVRNTIKAVRDLYSAGARQILVLNVPDLGVTPLGRSSGFGDLISQACADYNLALQTNLDALAAAGIPTIRVDSFSVLRLMVNFPVVFGFTNVREPFLAVGGNPDPFLFWDPVHPTTRGHRVLADEARDELILYYSPRQGRGLPPAVINSLNGLVHSRKSRH